MSSINISGYRLEVLTVQRNHVPGRVPIGSCGFQSIPCRPLDKDSEQSLLSGERFVWVDRPNKGIDQTGVTHDTVTYHPSSEVDDIDIKMEMVLKRELIEDVRVVGDPTWSARVDLIDEIFFNNPYLFSFSIIPKDPRIEQTVYIKKAREERPADLPLTRSSVTTNPRFFLDEVVPQEPFSNNFQGFLKPYPTYISQKCKPQFDAKDIPNYYNSYSMDQALKIEGAASSVINHFKNDIHAQAIGFTLLKPQEGRVEHLFIYK